MECSIVNIMRSVRLGGDSRKVFNGMNEHNAMAWTTIILG